MNKKILIGSLMAMTLITSACNSTNNQKKMLIGDISISQLSASYPSFDIEQQSFTISTNEKKQVKQWPESLRIDVYFGIWCHDSQREVPRLLNLLKHNSSINTHLIALDYQKSDPQGKALANKIKFTPTFIVYRNNKEIGRIIERPQVSLVADVTSFIEKS